MNEAESNICTFFESIFETKQDILVIGVIVCRNSYTQYIFLKITISEQNQPCNNRFHNLTYL